MSERERKNKRHEATKGIMVNLLISDITLWTAMRCTNDTLRQEFDMEQTRSLSEYLANRYWAICNDHSIDDSNREG